MRAVLRVMVGLCGLAILSGCSGAAMGPAVKREMTLGFSPEQQARMQALDKREYLIRRGDTLGVQDMFNEQLNQDSVLVLPDGRASFFGLDQIMVAGLTLSELDDVLTRAYAKEFREPRIAVSVRELGANDVYVLGEVERPGAYEIPGAGFSVVAALALAGGFTKYADKGSVVLVRVTPQGYLFRELNLAGFAAGKGFDPALIDLQSYDVIYVSRSAIGDFAAFTDGLIRNLLQYTQLAVDMRYILDGNLIRR